MLRLTAACALVLAAGGVVAGCAEKLDAPGACPTTCSGASSDVRTVDLDAAVVTDTAVLGGLGLGTQSEMLLASRGDTLDTRVIIRFDSLPSRSRPKSSDTATVAINYVDSAYLSLKFDTTGAVRSGPVTLSLYDVTGATNDTAVASLAPYFDAAHHIIDTTFATVPPDSIHFRLPNDFLLAKAQAGARLRVGLQISSTGSVQTRLFSSNTTLPSQLSMRTSADTAVPRVTLGPYSATPTDNTSLAASLADFTIVVKGASPPAPGLLAVGGLPAQRSYLQFVIPASIVDSSLVIRATLLLTQIPSAGADAGDTMSVQPMLVTAGPAVTDPAKAAQIASATLSIGGRSLAFEPLQTIPAASGQRGVEIAPAFLAWTLQPATDLPRAIALESGHEDASAQRVLFYSSEAANPSLRPKLRISYSPRARIGVP